MTIHVFDAPPAITGSACPIDQRERTRLRTAALRARRVYPGELGELVQRELGAFADLGLRFAADALLPRLADVVLATPLPGDEQR
ncbi:hypothetical protein [Pseudonocardia sp. GCM10023141]|uniref:hypothetical protein n=1 Tax=Pseudonocardia sp. GCM10023141 TaxID=3252653 RepID=UPI003622588E